MAYVVNRFPNFIETMIYREIGALRALGEEIDTFSIRRPLPNEVPAEAEPLLHDTIYVLPIGVFRLLMAHVSAVFRYPLRYWTTLFHVITGTHVRCADRIRTLCHFVEGISLLDRMRTRRIEHIHAHWAVGSATCAMVVSRLLRIPFSFTAHAYDIWRDKLLLPQKLRAASFVVTCTDYNRQHLARTYRAPLNRLHVIHHGVDVDQFRPARRAATSKPLLLSVGRLVEQKGFDRLVRACAVLLDRGYDFRCEIVGDGPLRSALQQLAESLRLEGHVVFLGAKLPEYLIAHYAAADIFVLPCLPASDHDRDGIPNTLIEAMSMEVPVVSTRFSGVPELITDDSGLLVEPGDVEGLATAVGSLLERPDKRRTMGAAGRRRVLGDFTIQISARKLQAVFAAC